MRTSPLRQRVGINSLAFRLIITGDGKDRGDRSHRSRDGSTRDQHGAVREWWGIGRAEQDVAGDEQFGHPRAR